MTKVALIRPEYVDRIPTKMQDGVLYISKKYSTAAHNCCCGCGVKIVTPLKAGRWSLETNGSKVSIRPSIGNWSSACQSHYWITNNQIQWAWQYTEAEIAANRIRDKHTLERVRARSAESTPAKEADMLFRIFQPVARIIQTIKGWF